MLAKKKIAGVFAALSRIPTRKDAANAKQKHFNIITYELATRDTRAPYQYSYGYEYRRAEGRCGAVQTGNRGGAVRPGSRGGGTGLRHRQVSQVSVSL